MLCRDGDFQGRINFLNSIHPQTIFYDKYLSSRYFPLHFGLRNRSSSIHLFLVQEAPASSLLPSSYKPKPATFAMSFQLNERQTMDGVGDSRPTTQQRKMAYLNKIAQQQQTMPCVPNDQQHMSPFPPNGQQKGGYQLKRQGLGIYQLNGQQMSNHQSSNHLCPYLYNRHRCPMKESK